MDLFANDLKSIIILCPFIYLQSHNKLEIVTEGKEELVKHSGMNLKETIKAC